MTFAETILTYDEPLGEMGIASQDSQIFKATCGVVATRYFDIPADAFESAVQKGVQ